jgi:nickel/cobalt transporter (NicO) family protein
MRLRRLREMMMTVRRRWVRFATLTAIPLLAALPLLQVSTALAHPLGNFTINRYARVEVYRDAIQVHYAVDMAEIPTFQLLGDLDSNHDGTPQQSELDAYAAQENAVLAGNLTLTAGGQKLDLSALDTSIQLLPGQGGLQVTRLAVVYEARIPATLNGRTAITFSDNNFNDRAGWKEIVVRASEGARLQVDQALTVDRSDALRSYPAETLESAPNDREVEFAWTAGTGSTAPASVNAISATTGRVSSGFAGLLHHDRSTGIIILSLLAAFGFGMLHALGPGHGKTVVAAYLVGSKGTARHAVILGLTVTATHTSSVYLIGFVTLWLSAYVVPETLYLYLGIASGLMVVAMGLALFASRLWRARHATPGGAHRHGLLGKAHSHVPAEHAHGSLATASAPPDEHEHEHAHTHPVDSLPARVTWRSLLALGVAGGMLPCPSAIVVMLAAISLGQVLFGMLLIVAFSLGLAGVLTTIGIVLVVGKRLSGRFGSGSLSTNALVARAITTLPVLSALGIAVAGLAITYQAWNQPGL